MNLSDKHLSTSRHSGKVLLASIMLVYYFIAFAVLIGYDTSIGALSKCDKTDAQPVALNSSKALKDKPKVGVVKGIVYSPPNSCAVVGETMMHIGDTIHVRQVVKEARETSKGDRGIVVFEKELINQRNEIVQTGTTTHLLAKKNYNPEE